MRLYPELGYHRLSVRALAAEAGLSSGMFHHLFDSKDAFVATLLQHKYELAFQALTAQVQEGVSVLERLRGALFFMACYAREHQDWIMRLLADGASGVAVVEHFLQNQSGSYRDVVLTLLDEGERAGLWRPAEPLQRFCYLMSSVVVPILIDARMRAGGLMPAALQAEIPRQVLSDRAIRERLDWSLAVLQRAPVDEALGGSASVAGMSPLGDSGRA